MKSKRANGLLTIGGKPAFNHDQIVDKIMAVLTVPEFPLLFSFSTGTAAGVRIALALTAEGEQGFAQAGNNVIGTVDAHAAFPLTIVQNMLALTPCGHVPKGLIREAYEDLSRRERNRRAAEAANREAFDADVDE